MKLYIIQRLDYQYNDEYYYTTGAYDKAIMAFKKKENAQEKLKELNEKAKKEEQLETEDGFVSNFYTIVEIDEVDEDEISYASAREKITKAKKAAKEIAQKEFKKGAESLFDKYPKLENFSFYAYTCYFNDGDTCNYSVYSDSGYINEIEMNDINGPFKYEYINGKYQSIPCEPHPLYEISQEVIKFIEMWDKEDIKSMFGDHVEVNISKKDGKVEITTSDHSDHD